MPVNEQRRIWWALVVCVCAVGWASRACAADSANFGQLQIPRIAAAPKLEDFLEMKPNAAWDGKLVQVEGLKQRIPSDGA